jgi:hypothetical protein
MAPVDRATTQVELEALGESALRRVLQPRELPQREAHGLFGVGE